MPSYRWAWGRMATAFEGWAPYPPALCQMWDRTQALAMSFDGQGISNMLWWVPLGPCLELNAPLFNSHAAGCLAPPGTLPCAVMLPSNKQALPRLPFLPQGVWAAAQAPRRPLCGPHRRAGLPHICSGAYCPQLCGTGPQHLGGGVRQPGACPARRQRPLMRLLIQESLRRLRQFNMQVGAGAGCRGAGCLLGVERRWSHPVTERAACMRMHTIPTTLHRAACPQALPTHSTLAPALLFAGNGQPGISHFSHGAADCGGCGHAGAAAGL
jgi:hypothetical protein